MSLTIRSWLTGPTLALLAACGGGGDGGSLPAAPNSPSGSSSYAPGVYQPSASLADQCVSPRSGTDPLTGRAYADRPGSAVTENDFLRSWTNELYLWYAEVPDLNPANYSTPAFFDLLRTSATTSSGRNKDQFHFTYDTDDYVALVQSGVEAGYGAQWTLIAARPPRRIVIAYVKPGTPAASASLTRGMEVLRIDGADFVNGNTEAIVNTLNAGLFPGGPNESHTFTVRDLSGATRTLTMVSAEIAYEPVREVRAIATPSGPVGYMVFNDHIATAEPALINAINTLRAQSIVDLIVDLRYNGGGFLDIASELSYMIGGQATLGRTFERLVFSDKHPTTNPVTGRPLAPTPFHTTTQGFSGPSGVALPTIDLPRVYVITGADTCSASESIINGLRGVGVEVYQIGSTTCGKPYGFYPRDNCGTTYFSIQFRGINDVNFGEYADGFSPQNTSGVAGARVPGCSVADDFTRALGDSAETRLAATLAFRASNNQSCPAPTGLAPGLVSKPDQPLSAVDGVMYKPPARANRLLRETTE